MRQIIAQQLQLGQISIEDIELDYQSRDDIPQILAGLQELYCNPARREALFACLAKLIPADVDAHNGRPGMLLWNVWVLGNMRLNLDCDYDRVMELANEHRTLRRMLGHDSPFDVNYQYRLQTIKDNVLLITREVADEINQIVVKAGHEVLGKTGVPLNTSCDSFAVKTNVHYPTDTNVLLDAMRKVIVACGKAAKRFGLPDWRQHDYNYRSLKNLYLKAVRLKHSTSQDEAKKAAQQEKIIQAVQALLERAEFYLARAEQTLDALITLSGSEDLRNTVDYFCFHARYQINLTRRRVIDGEVIPHADKIFSLFQPHTEWISKGKAGVPVELGIRTAVMKDQFGFLLHHKLMIKQTDEKVAVEMVEETRKRFPNVRMCSFDKGFWSPDNRKDLSEILEKVVMRKKGKLSKQDREIESDPEFIQACKQHSAVESAINALQVHGLDMCPDHGIEAFERYIALAVVSRNIQKLGAIILQQKRRAAKKLAQRQKLAA